MTTTENESKDPLLQAFGTIRTARNICMILILLSLLSVLLSAVLVGLLGISLPNAATADGQELKVAALTGVLCASQVAAPAACLVAIVAMSLATRLALLTRSGGVASYISAFFWALVLLLVLIPWQQFMAGLTIVGAVPTYWQLVQDTIRFDPTICNAQTWQACSLFYGRYVAYPLFAIVLWIIVMVKFARGWRGTFPAPAKLETAVATPTSRGPDSPAAM